MSSGSGMISPVSLLILVIYAFSLFLSVFLEVFQYTTSPKTQTCILITVFEFLRALSLMKCPSVTPGNQCWIKTDSCLLLLEYLGVSLEFEAKLHSCSLRMAHGLSSLFLLLLLLFLVALVWVCRKLGLRFQGPVGAIRDRHWLPGWRFHLKQICAWGPDTDCTWIHQLLLTL